MRSKLIKDGGVYLCLVFWNEEMMSETFIQANDPISSIFVPNDGKNNDCQIVYSQNGYKKQNFIELQLIFPPTHVKQRIPEE
jgi:hypothetical protein